jgi:hypothetical protein
MKILKYTFSIMLLIFAIYSCSEEDDIVNVDAIAAPTNVSASVRVTQDNTGLTTITPLGEGVTNFEITFGDGSDASGNIRPGRSVSHVYEEGTYEITIRADGLNGLSTTIVQTIVVSFQAPQNLVVTITNDPTISKKVNVMASADFAMSYEVDFGEAGSEPVEGNIDETVSYIYQEAGTYTITVTAFSAAVETTVYTEEFVVTAILQPLTAAPQPPSRQPENVISIYSDAYENIPGTDFYPNWGQSTTFNEIVVNGSNIIQYGNLNYQGIQLGTPADASQMEFLHIDIWTADDNEAKISPISPGPNETAFDLDLTAQQWTSFNIPISFFTDQNPLVDFADIIQFKFDGNPAGGTIFIDNLYFYVVSSSPFDDGLLTNGDFENGSDSWIVGVDDNTPAPVVTEGGSTYYSVDVTAAGNPYDVNVSQKVEIIQGETYTLTFDAWSDVNRTILAGIGLSGGDFSNTSETVNITPAVTNYTLTLAAAGFGALDARVLFDLGAEIGMVNIDNVSLMIITNNLLTNGDFENGSDSWIVGVDDNAPAPVVTDGGNTYYSVDVTAAGNPFDVNVSQKLEIIEGETYTLTFDAWSDVNRSIIAGIGLSGGSFANTSETVNITPTITNYTLTLSATGFGALDARVLFDLGAEVGMVNIDNVTLSVN